MRRAVFLLFRAALLRVGTRARILVAVGEDAPAARVAALAASGVTVLQCKSHEGRVDVADLCARLFGLDVIAMLLEAGSELTGAFVRAGLVDRVAAFVAPKLLGGAAAPTAAGGAGLPLGDAALPRDVSPLADPRHRELQVLQRVRVREPQVALAARAERGAAQGRDARFVEDPLLHGR